MMRLGMPKCEACGSRLRNGGSVCEECERAERETWILEAVARARRRDSLDARRRRLARIGRERDAVEPGEAERRREARLRARLRSNLRSASMLC